MDLSQIESIVGVAALVLVAVISPGPDFAVVVRNSLIYSRRVGFLTALGIALGIMVHVTYTLLGLGLLLSQIAWLFHAIRFVGAGYLIYIGGKGILAKKGGVTIDKSHKAKNMSTFAAIRSGFLTSALNPKAMLFFISLFSAVIPPDTPAFVMMLDALVVFLETVIWFSFIAYCLSGEKTREKFYNVSHWIERVTGSLLLFIGIKFIVG